MLDGFGSSRTGDDLFDAVVGLFGMIDAVRRAPEPELPDDPAVRQLEGWMFGQHARCPDASPTAHEPGREARPDRHASRDQDVRAG